MEPKRPLLRYFGGKWKMADWIVGNFPEHVSYVEPFGGGASVLLKKPRARIEVYNDLDGEMVNLFRMLRDHPARMIERLELTLYSRQEFKEAYEPTDDLFERACRTMVRAHMGYGSRSVFGAPTGFRGLRSNRNTTAAQDWRNFPDHLPAIVERLRGVTFEHQPALKVIKFYDTPNTLHYIDPPYVLSSRSKEGASYRHEMTDLEHEELAALLCAVRGSVCVSAYHSDLYDRLYAGWDQIENEGAYTMKAGKRTEVLWLKNVNRGLFSL